jgi:glycosyltransferase involved in cell wall biosynthesis
MKVGLIISTYNWKEALNVVLESVKLQTSLPEEIVVCDDGSSDDSEELVKNHQKNFPCILKHVWQEDNGFRVAASRNNGINELSEDTDYVVIIDGDMILHPSFIEDHVYFAEKNCFTQGSRVLISEEKTTQILSRGEINSIISFFSKGIRKRKNTIYLRFFSSLLDRPNKQLKGIRACNMGFWKKDLYSVNGFNEKFVGWGREDSEIVVRLFNKGIMRKNIKFSAIAYHLYHKEKSILSVSINDKYLFQTVSSKTSWCNKGLIKSENHES